MSCKSCQGKTKYVTACKVCELVDGITELKETKYCKTCKAYICENCQTDILKRAKAFIRSIWW